MVCAKVADGKQIMGALITKAREPFLKRKLANHQLRLAEKIQAGSGAALAQALQNAGGPSAHAHMAQGAGLMAGANQSSACSQ